MKIENAAEPCIGMGATICYWSDRHACTITNVLSPKKIEVIEDEAIRIDKNGMSEDQEYYYKPAMGTPQIFVLRKNGRWVRKGESMKSGAGLVIGVRDSYYDYSF